MAEGFAPSIADELFDALLNSDAYDGPANTYAKLHIGAPGAAGTSNAATETTRKEVTWGASSGGTILNDNTLTWTNIAGSQDASHFTLWDHVSAGNFMLSGSITANAYVAGDTYSVAVGAVTGTLSVAS